MTMTTTVGAKVRAAAGISKVRAAAAQARPLRERYFALLDEQAASGWTDEAKAKEAKVAREEVIEALWTLLGAVDEYLADVPMEE